MYIYKNKEKEEEYKCMYGFAWRVLGSQGEREGVGGLDM